MVTHRRSPSSCWEDLTLGSVEALVKVLSDHEHLEWQVARRRFEERARGFSEAVGFLEAMGGVKVDGAHIRRARNLAVMVEALNLGKQEFLRHLVKAVVVSHTVYGEELCAACRAFDLEAGRIRMKWSENRDGYYAARNVLVEGGGLRLQHSTGWFSISNWFHSDFIRATYGTGPSPDQLRTRKRDQAEIGYTAELEVVNFERQVVGKRDSQKVIHIAMENTAAGFDIASVRRDEDSDEIVLRLIEVKAVSPKDWAFIFTRNEVQIARENGSSYFLYLVPVKNGQPRVEEVLVVENPVEELMKEHEWRIEQGAWNVSKRESHER